MDKVTVVSLGCPKNLVDSDNLLSGLRNEGFISTQDYKDADIILVNTCGFIEAAKRESIEEILRLKALKAEGKRLIVFGCLAQRYKDELIKEIPEIDGIWGVGEEDRIIEYCKRTGAKGKGQGALRKGVIPVAYSPSPITSSSYAYLKIAEGCNRGCTFCVIPSIRGSFRSNSPDIILKDAERHIKAGVKEMILIAQDIGSYGKEVAGYNLSRLVRDIASISGDFWIRLLYLYPAAINNELLSVVADEKKVCKYLDIPFQHSEDRILRAMGRAGTKASYKKEIEKIRKVIPGITLRTTFIVGFPGETEADFQGLRTFIEDIRFDRLGVFTYSREEGSGAYSMKGNVPKKIKESRQHELMQLQSHISLERNKALTGRRFRALVDEVEGEVAVARLYSHAPEIDGVVIIEQGQGLRVKGQGIESKVPDSRRLSEKSKFKNLKVGDFVTVEIVEAYDYDLKGVIVNE